MNLRPLLIAMAGALALAGCQLQPALRPVEASHTTPAIALLATPGETVVGSAQFSRTLGAVRGGASGGTAGAGFGLATGPLAPLAVPLFAGVGAAVGSVAGAVESGGSGTLPAAQAAAVDRALEQAARIGNLSDGMLQAALAEARLVVPYRLDAMPADSDAGRQALASHRDARYAALLEFHVDRIGLVGVRGLSSNRALYMTAQVKYYDAASGRPTLGRGLVYQSDGHGAVEWAADDARLVTIEVERGYRALAQRTVESVLLGADVGAIRAVGPRHRDGFGCGLIPTTPAPRFKRFLLGKPHPQVVRADSTTPLLAWQPYVDSRRSGAATAVRYDLRIWATGAGPAAPVYERFDLPSPAHRVERPLAAGTTYFWSVRPRFDEGGKPRAERWSVADGIPFAPHREAAAASYSSVFLNGEYAELHCPTPSAMWWAVYSDSVDSEQWRTCRCLDYAPADSQYRFVTPGGGAQLQPVDPPPVTSGPDPASKAESAQD